MTNFRFQTRKMVTMVACLVVTVMFSSCKDRENKIFDLNGTVTISPTVDVFTGTELTAAYSGSETVTWQWNKDGAAISGATAAKYTPTEAGSYTATASAPGFNSKTSAAVEVKTAIYLLETIQVGTELRVYEYDSQNRIAKISYGNTSNEDINQVHTYYYNLAGDLVEMKVELTHNPEGNYSTTFSKSGNKITATTESDGYNEYIEFELNAQGLPEKVKVEGEEDGDEFSYTRICTWQNGNLTKIVHNDGYTSEALFTYDDKKSPFYYCQTPKWYLMWWHHGFESENNIKTQTWVGGTLFTYDYTYLNEEGFPVTQTWSSSTTTYTYMKK